MIFSSQEKYITPTPRLYSLPESDDMNVNVDVIVEMVEKLMIKIDKEGNKQPMDITKPFRGRNIV